jgi:hypothetical protein
MEIKSLYMKSILVFCLYFLLMLGNLFAQPVLSTGGKEMPNEWIDSATGHRVVKMTRKKNTSNLGFYFHNNPFIGNKMVYYSSDKNNTAGVAKQETFSVNSRKQAIVAGPPRLLSQSCNSRSLISCAMKKTCSACISLTIH